MHESYPRKQHQVERGPHEPKKYIRNPLFDPKNIERISDAAGIPLPIEEDSNRITPVTEEDAGIPLSTEEDSNPITPVTAEERDDIERAMANYEQFWNTEKDKQEHSKGDASPVKGKLREQLGLQPTTPQDVYKAKARKIQESSNRDHNSWT